MFHFYLTASFILFLAVVGAPTFTIEQEFLPIDDQRTLPSFRLPDPMKLLTSMLESPLLKNPFMRTEENPMRNPFAISVTPSADFMAKRQDSAIATDIQGSFDAEICVFTAHLGPSGTGEREISARVVGENLVVQTGTVVSTSSTEEEYAMLSTEESSVITVFVIPPTCRRLSDEIVQFFNKETGIFTVTIPDVEHEGDDDKAVESSTEGRVEVAEDKNDILEVKSIEVDEFQLVEDDAVKSQFNIQSLDLDTGATDGTKINEIISIMKL